MRVGVFIEETWDFFHEIYADLEQHHQPSVFKQRQVETPIFRERILRYVQRRHLAEYIAAQDVLFFEWASEALAQVSHLPKTRPIVTRLHRYELYQHAASVNWDAVDGVILVTQAKQREFIRRFPAQAAKTVVIPEAVSLERFQSRIKPYAKDIGILCHLTPRKRVYELVLAFAELLQSDPGYRLHIGGDEHELYGDYYEALTQVVEKLGIQHAVQFYGMVKDPENWYRKIDVIISNSYSEGLQVSPMEAIASGCYCLCHDWDGADEFYPAENRYLLDSELVEKIRAYDVLTQAEKEARIGSLQVQIRKHFNVDQTKVQIRQVLEAAAAGGGRR
jgi:glycosyltransferase involved in cell wall biosynthesis